MQDLYQADYLFACAEANDEDVTNIRNLIFQLRGEVKKYERTLEERLV